MERAPKINAAKELFGSSFIGPEEINGLKSELQFLNVNNLKSTSIPFDLALLDRLKSSHFLFYFHPYFKDNSFVTIMKLRSFFGSDASISEPCFYNQDWYLNERFASSHSIGAGWYLIQKEVATETRGLSPETIDHINAPPILLCTYLFFLHYTINNSILWENDYIWCDERDMNGDLLYVGRYKDASKLVKNGFSVHRHLRIKNNYGSVGFVPPTYTLSR